MSREELRQALLEFGFDPDEFRELSDEQLVARADETTLDACALLERIDAARQRLARELERASRCLCHDIAHTECPGAELCLGKCGRKTTPFESTAPGYCGVCAADPRWRPIGGGGNG